MCCLAWTDTACLLLGAFTRNAWRTLTLGRRFHQFHKAFPQTCVSSKCNLLLPVLSRFPWLLARWWSVCAFACVRVWQREISIGWPSEVSLSRVWTRTWKWFQKAFMHFHFIYQQCTSAYVLKVVWHIPMQKKAVTCDLMIAQSISELILWQ